MISHLANLVISLKTIYFQIVPLIRYIYISNFILSGSKKRIKTSQFHRQIGIGGQ